jgi:tetratricopeptide (TPR) repeat protein
MTDTRQQDLLNTASRLREMGRVPEAIAAYRNLLTAFPDLPDSWYNLGWLCRQAGFANDALAAYDEALKRGIQGAEEVYLNRAALFADAMARPAEAKADLEKAIALNPSYLPAYLNLGNLHEDLGDRDGAKAAYLRALDLKPANAIALSRLAGLGRATSPDDPMILRIRAVLGSGVLLPADKALLLFALGRLEDSCAAYDAAAKSFADANACARIAASGNVAPYSGPDELLRADRCAAAFSTPDARTGGLLDAYPQPVFIVGMFRSGSTLLEQILGSHSQITAGGELELVTRIARGLGWDPATIAQAPATEVDKYAEAYLSRIRTMYPGAGIVTDKRPDNFWFIGLIKRMFPGARILNTVRHPLDTLVSVWTQYLASSLNYGYFPEDIASHLHAERRMMAHWERLYPGDILTVPYEQLVRNPEREIRRVLEFLNLPFEPECLDFHKTEGPVKTASVWQVREPLHGRSIGRWKNYEAYFQSLPPHPALDALLGRSA